MIHNVSGEVRGSIKDIESGLQLMRNLQKNSVDAYVAQTGISEADIIDMMDKETWMTAGEALQKKFIDAIIEKTNIAPSNFADIKNCGYRNLPIKIENYSTNNNPKEMTLDQINKATGKDFKTEAEAIEYIANLQAENARVSAEKKQAEQSVKNKEIGDILEKAVADKKILPAQKDTYKKFLESTFDDTKKLIDEMQPVELLSKKIVQKGNSIGGNTTEKTYKQLAETEPQTLKDMFENDFPKFNELFKAEYGKDYQK